MDLRLFHFGVVKYANQKKEQRKEMLQAWVQILVTDLKCKKNVWTMDFHVELNLSDIKNLQNMHK